MAKRVDKITTRIVGKQERFDQRKQNHTRLALGELGKEAQKRWNSESLDPFRRIFFPETRPMNVPMRSWDKIADGPLNPEKIAVEDIEKLSHQIKEVARFLGAKLVGICELNPAYVYSHKGLKIDFAKGRAGEEIPIEHKYAISVAVEMDYDNFRYSPCWIDNAEVGKGYLEAAKVAVCLAAYIRELGYPAKAHFFINEQVLHVPIAVEAGLGELGRNNILITAEYGPRVRLATVTTNLPLAPDKPVDLGVQQFCQVCKKCAKCCPSQSIPHGDKMVVRGVEKWQTDQDRCARFWMANPKKWNDCGRCISVCPWNKPNVWWHRLALKFSGSYLGAKLLLLIDDIIYGSKPHLRYRKKWLNYSTFDYPEYKIAKDMEDLDSRDAVDLKNGETLSLWPM